MESIKSCQNLEINYGKEIDENNDVKLEDVKLRVKDNYQQWLVPDNSPSLLPLKHLQYLRYKHLIYL